jgi:large subunit ribosomal protein L4
MNEVPVFNAKGDRVGAVDFADDAFGGSVKGRLLKDVLVASESRRRSGNADTKERGEIKGSTRKPWRQKGTGHARSGSRKSPLWRGGGTIFGPHPRDYSRDVPRRQRRAALRSALALKLREGRIKVVTGLAMSEPKTGDLRRLLARMGAARSAVVVTSQFDRNLWLSARNLPSVDTVTADRLDARGVSSRQNVVITEDAVELVRNAGSGGGSREKSES